jgi:hypothetical protein
LPSNTNRLLAVTRNDDPHPLSLVMSEAIVLSAADIDPTLLLEPGNDLARIGLNRRHGERIYCVYICA